MQARTEHKRHFTTQQLTDSVVRHTAYLLYIAALSKHDVSCKLEQKTERVLRPSQTQTVVGNALLVSRSAHCTCAARFSAAVRGVVRVSAGEEMRAFLSSGSSIMARSSQSAGFFASGSCAAWPRHGQRLLDSSSRGQLRLPILHSAPVS